MRETGLEIIEMDLEFKHGRMVQDMKEIGKTIKLVEMVSLLMLTEMSIKGSGKMIKQMVMEFLCM